MTRNPSGAASLPARAPLERGRAIGVLVGLALFGVGFAVAAVLVAVAAAAYLVAVTVGLVGVGVVGVAMSRGTVPMPEAPIWAPSTLRLVARAAGAPELPVVVLLYALAAIGALGNIVLPLVLR